MNAYLCFCACFVHIFMCLHMPYTYTYKHVWTCTYAYMFVCVSVYNIYAQLCICPHIQTSMGTSSTELRKSSSFFALPSSELICLDSCCTRKYLRICNVYIDIILTWAMYTSAVGMRVLLSLINLNLQPFSDIMIWGKSTSSALMHTYVNIHTKIIIFEASCVHVYGLYLLWMWMNMK
jgi:hypothetical protein